MFRSAFFKTVFPDPKISTDVPGYSFCHDSATPAIVARNQRLKGEAPFLRGGKVL
jgi:hypothetical protein